MRSRVAKIRKMLGDKLIGNVHMRELVCQTIALLPEELANRVAKNVWFVSSPEDSWAFTFRGAEIKDYHLIFISDELFSG